MKNKIGIIVANPPDADFALVGFGKEGGAGFPKESLILLRDPEKARADANRYCDQLSLNNYDESIEVTHLAASPLAGIRKIAIKLAKKNRTVMAYTMHSLIEELKLE